MPLDEVNETKEKASVVVPGKEIFARKQDRC